MFTGPGKSEAEVEARKKIVRPRPDTVRPIGNCSLVL